LFVDGKPPKDFRNAFLKAIRFRAFEPLKPEDEEQERTGWCVVDRVFDLELNHENVYHDAYLLLGFRVDRWRLPSAVLKAQAAEEERQLLARTGKEKLSKRERADVKARVAARMKKKLTPSSKVIDVCWHIDSGVVRFWSHSERLQEDFAVLFEKTFGLKLAFESPFLAAFRAELSAGEQRSLSAAQAACFAVQRSPEAAEPPPRELPSGGDMMERVETTRFLGNEFLTWLWFTSETAEGRVKLGAKKELELWLDRSLELRSRVEGSERLTLQGMAPTATPEARQALKQDKLPHKARINVRVDEQDFAFVLTAPMFALSAATLPAVLSKQDADEMFLERMRLLEQLENALDALYAKFLRGRLSSKWSTQLLPALHAWVGEDRQLTAAAYSNLVAAGRQRGGKPRGDVAPAAEE
jgi:hypothetical protein